MKFFKLIRSVVLFVCPLTSITLKLIIHNVKPAKHSFQTLSALDSSRNTPSSIKTPTTSSSQPAKPSNLIVTGDSVKLTLGQRVAFPGDYLVHEQYGFGQYIGIRFSNLTPSRQTTGIYEPVVVVAFSDGEGYWFKRLAAKELYIYRSFSTVAMSATSGSSNLVGADEDAAMDSLDNLEMAVESATSSETKATTASKTSKTKMKKTASTTTATTTAASTQSFNQQESLLSSLCDTKRWKKRFNAVKNQSKSTAVNLVKLMTIRNNFHRLPCTSPPEEKLTHFQSTFKFRPTSDQVNCFEAVYQDLIKSSKPMDRLVCGDVGFGKTEVAMRAMFIVVHSQRQVAVLAPTRVLALQHLRTIQERMPEVNVMLLRGGGKQDATNVKQSLESGECQIVVGTHALLQSGIQFKRLGLLVIDEEQRFGVGHKEKLKVVSSGLDVLTLSATPIPRTLHMSVSGLRDLSLMTAPPLGRKEVQVTVGVWEDQTAVQVIQKELSRNGQVFIVVPFVKDCALMKERLHTLLPTLSIQEAHGHHIDLEDRIDSFRKHEYDVLIATTVIENGIDMPNVNTILVYCADRFGMSALYQLRGRVGRSSKQAYAYFFTNTTVVTTDAENRLMYLKTFTALGSGYELSMRDMDMRGSGSLFGEQQSGSSDIGIDLQAKILAQSLEKLKSDVVLPVTDTRISLSMNVEVLRNMKKPELMSQNAWLLSNTHHNNNQHSNNNNSNSNNNNNNNNSNNNNNNIPHKQQQQQQGAEYLKNNNNMKNAEDSIKELIELNLNEVSIWEDKMIEVVLSRIFPAVTTSTTNSASASATTAASASKQQLSTQIPVIIPIIDTATTANEAGTVITKSKATKTKKVKKGRTIEVSDSTNTSNSETDTSGNTNNIILPNDSFISAQQSPSVSTTSTTITSTSILKAILTAAGVNDFANIEKECLLKLSSMNSASSTSSASIASNCTIDENQPKQASSLSSSFLPAILSELLRRSEIRMLSRRLGITDVFLTTPVTLQTVPQQQQSPQPTTIPTSLSTLTLPTVYKLLSSLNTAPTTTNINHSSTNLSAASNTAAVTIICVASGVNEKKWNILKRGIPQDMQENVIFSSHLVVTAATTNAAIEPSSSSATSLPLTIGGNTFEHKVNYFALTINHLPNSDQFSLPPEFIWKELQRLLQALTIELTVLYDKVTADCIYEKPPE